MAGKLEGKVAVVTGGNSGIGLATAKRFAAEGAFVFITGRRQAELDKAAREIGPNAFPVQGNVADLADLDRLYATVEREQGGIDILFANAGVSAMMPLGSITEEHFDQIFNANVRGLLFSVQKALPLFRDGGSIVLNASVASVGGIGGLSIYSASKAAVRSFARTWSSDLKERKIRVNVVSPGVIVTPIYDSLMPPEQVDQFLTGYTSDLPVGRPGTADEIAKAVVFLVSDDSSYVAGVELFVDGGFTKA